ncbi:ImmA/IrrE family metallo-endopeptidase [Chrysiogenes arsenatis]|uniref:ImmA/IrrE family metallo-endopeptidase n=1 Tax=Chrysiogenes arsenatis TaxID=309797 RepID=UPI00135F1C47|nr:ImmA/IrrE family metallo-endopeptidase [Chrysiogenes arsenatis]
MSEQPPAFFLRLDFLKQSRYLAPYNAFLIAQQRPDAQLVFSESKWKVYDRYVLPGAAPIVTLIPFGPVAFVYDIRDTDGRPIEGYESDIPLGALCDRLFPFEGSVGADLELAFRRLVYNCDKKNIHVEFKPLSVFQAGYVTCYTQPDEKNSPQIHYSLTINSNHGIAQQFPTLVHELAHIFCDHLSERTKRLSHEIEELEAEAVAYLFCYRKGFRPCSEKYLIDFFEQGIDVPLSHFEIILKAHREIEKLQVADIGDTDLIPVEFHFSVGGYFGSSYALTLKDETIDYEIWHLSDGHVVPTTVLSVKKGAWSKFLQVCHEINVWDWNSRYVNPGVCDGTQWQFVLRLPYAFIESSGDNSYPPEFDRLLAAASRLANGVELK